MRRSSTGVLFFMLAGLLVTAGAQAKPARPDLRVGAFTVPAAAGTVLQGKLTTTNPGRGRSRASRTALFASRDAKRSRDDIRLVRVSVRALAPRRSLTRNVRIVVPARVKPGVYRVLACADETRRVREHSERNNCRAGRGVLTVPATPGTTVPLTVPTTPAAATPAPEAKPADPNDLDADGVPNAQDCAPEDGGAFPGAPDRPDVPALRDTNCDGLDGDAARSVFVATTGNDAAPGTREQPKRTVQAAIAAAAPLAFDVLLAEGDYAAALTVTNGVGVYGGYAAGWSRGLDRLTRLTAAGRIGANATGIDRPTTLQLLTIKASDAARFGQGSYGLIALRAPALVLERVTAIAGPGSDALHAAAGTNGRPGGKGGDGADGACDADEDRYGAGGTAGTSPVPGRAGGIGGAGSYTSYTYSGGGAKGGGTHGGAGGPGGAHGDPGAIGGEGSGGEHGTPGTNGAGGIGASLSHTTGELVGDAGSPGTPGGHGHGGGGGGGGGSQKCFTCDYGRGNGGGGGGGGGEGGFGGFGGAGGGSSIGISIADSHGIVIRDSRAVGGAAGDGGGGGAGGQGGAGGLGGAGADYCTSQIGRGGNGGMGGFGSYGGAGGGGEGGYSLGLLDPARGATVTNTAFAFGTPGKGGAGAGFNGAPGRAGERIP